MTSTELPSELYGIVIDDEVVETSKNREKLKMRLVLHDENAEVRQIQMQDLGFRDVETDEYFTDGTLRAAGGSDLFEDVTQTEEIYLELKEVLAPVFERLGKEYDRETIRSAVEWITRDLRYRNAFNTYDIDDDVFDRLQELKYENDIEIVVAGIDPMTFATACKEGNPLLHGAEDDLLLAEFETAWEELQKLATEHGTIVFEAFFDMVIMPLDIEPEYAILSDTTYYPRQEYVDSLLQILEHRFGELSYRK